MNVDGSAREHTKTHACQTEADRAGDIYFVRRKFCFCDVAAEISDQVPGPRLWYDVRLQGLYVQGLYVGSAQLFELAHET